MSNTNPKTQQDTAIAIQTFAMFHYQALLEEGYSQDVAKADTAQLLEDEYNRFAERGNLNAKTLGTVERRLEKLIEQTKAVAAATPAARPLYDDLLSLQAQVRRKQ